MQEQDLFLEKLSRIKIKLELVVDKIEVEGLKDSSPVPQVEVPTVAVVKVAVNETRGRKTKYTEQDKLDIIASLKSTKQFAKQFDTTPNNIIKLRYRWKAERKIIMSQSRKVFKYNHIKPSNDYKVAPAEEQ